MATARQDKTSSAEAKPSTADSLSEQKQPRRTIPGDFSYTATHGKFRTALQNMVKAERPDSFNKDFVSAYLGVAGGSATPIPPILRRMGFLSADNKPTDLYAKFQNDNQRPAAALEGLRRAFAELFKHNLYAHTLNEDEIKNILVEITGLKKTDPVISSIYGTFDALRHFIPHGYIPNGDSQPQAVTDDFTNDNQQNGSLAAPPLGLSYHINIVLPETKDIAVFNAIFQSLKANMLS